MTRDSLPEVYLPLSARRAPGGPDWAVCGLFRFTVAGASEFRIMDRSSHAVGESVPEPIRRAYGWRDEDVHGTEETDFWPRRFEGLGNG